jgi:WD40 repeat protein
VWHTTTGEVVKVLNSGRKPGWFLAFTASGNLLSNDKEGLWQWDTSSWQPTLLYAGEGLIHFAISGDLGSVVLTEKIGISARQATVLRLESGESWPLPSHGNRVMNGALDHDGTIVVTTDSDGLVRVGPVTGEEPHLLPGHEGGVWAAVHPSGTLIATGGADTTIRFWPMPDLSRPPLHTLPRAELIAKLGTLTNLRVKRDREADEWQLVYAPFQGWKEAPSW